MGPFNGVPQRPALRPHQLVRSQASTSSHRRVFPRELQRQEVRRPRCRSVSHADWVLQWPVRYLVRRTIRWRHHRGRARPHQDHQPEWGHQVDRLSQRERPLEDQQVGTRLRVPALDHLDLHTLNRHLTPGRTISKAKDRVDIQLLTSSLHQE